MKIKELLPTNRHTKGDIGIEVEMEGRNLPKDLNNKFWTYEHDGSLAGYDNAEYVLINPIKIGDLTKSITSLKGILGGSTLEPSVRTGVHIHINVQELTIQQVATMTTLYLVVEDLLLTVCGEGRQSNLFCLKGCEAEYLTHRAAQFFRTGDVAYIADDLIRYSGLNLHAICKYGSVEFRSLRTPEDLTDIEPWAASLYHLKELALEEFETPAQVIQHFSDFDPAAFISKVMPYYSAQLMDVDGWEAKLKRGMRSAQDVAFCKNWGPSKRVNTILPKPLQELANDHPNMDIDELLNLWGNRL